MVYNNVVFAYELKNQELYDLLSFLLDVNLFLEPLQKYTQSITKDDSIIETRTPNLMFIGVLRFKVPQALKCYLSFYDL